MKAPSALARAIQRKRIAMMGHPKKPKGFDDLETIPLHLTQTADKQPFLILNATVHPGDVSPNQCCQPAKISAAKHKSGPRKISAAEKIRGRIFCRITQKWQKRGRTFKSVFFT
jgi:hypothetical protein